MVDSACKNGLYGQVKHKKLQFLSYLSLSYWHRRTQMESDGKGKRCKLKNCGSVKSRKQLGIGLRFWRNDWLLDFCTVRLICPSISQGMQPVRRRFLAATGQRSARKCKANLSRSIMQLSDDAPVSLTSTASRPGSLAAAGQIRRVATSQGKGNG